MGQLRTANKRHKRALLLLQARKAPARVDVPAPVVPAKATS
jgi:hypothetical protein